MAYRDLHCFPDELEALGELQLVRCVITGQEGKAGGNCAGKRPSCIRLTKDGGVMAYDTGNKARIQGVR